MLNQDEQQLNPLVPNGNGTKPAVRNPPAILRESLQADSGNPFAYRGSSFAPRGPSNGPDSHALDPAPDSSNPMRSQAGPLSKAAQALPAINPFVQGGNTANASMTNAALVNPIATTPDAQQNLAERQAGHMIENNLRQFEDKGNGIVRQVGADGKTQFTNVGTAEVTDPSKTVPVNVMNLAADNASLAKANAIRQEILDRQPQGGVAVMADPNEAANAEKAQRWRQDELLSQASRGNQPAVAAAIHANAQTEVEAGRNSLNALSDAARNTVTMRGQDINAKSVDARLAGNPLVAELNRAKIQGAQIENGQSQRLSDLQQQLVAETDPAKQAAIATQIKVLSGNGGKSSQGDTLTLPQTRSNFEIDAARERVAGMDPAEIKRRTANYTATGRENPDFDPTLAKAVSLANRRKYGADDHFDQREQAQQPAGTDGDVVTRFRGDKAMQGYKLGKQTDRGHEVLDGAGKVIGHWN